jgi:hypothetical protein
VALDGVEALVPGAEAASLWWRPCGTSQSPIPAPAAESFKMAFNFSINVSSLADLNKLLESRSYVIG